MSLLDAELPPSPWIRQFPVGSGLSACYRGNMTTSLSRAFPPSASHLNGLKIQTTKSGIVATQTPDGGMDIQLPVSKEDVPDFDSTRLKKLISEPVEAEKDGKTEKGTRITFTVPEHVHRSEVKCGIVYQNTESKGVGFSFSNRVVSLTS
jgi:hypothetical protein